jgi:hypothetical protein
LLPLLLGGTELDGHRHGESAGDLTHVKGAEAMVFTWGQETDVFSRLNVRVSVNLMRGF